MRVPSNELRQQICDTLKSFYTAKPSRQKLDSEFIVIKLKN